jgi:hypothetical protein
MRHFALAASFAGGVLAGAPAAADVLVNISKSSQKMAVSVDGGPQQVWTISTGKRGYSTPNGSYRPTRLERDWYSRQYKWAPMPYSVFFHRGYAVHGTTEVGNLGRPASHGCVRLHPQHAEKLFTLVRAQFSKTRIVVSNLAIKAPATPPEVPVPPRKAPPPDAVPEASVTDEGRASLAMARQPDARPFDISAAKASREVPVVRDASVVRIRRAEPPLDPTYQLHTLDGLPRVKIVR